MIRERSTRQDPGQTFIVYRNASGTTLLKGTPVVLDPATADGVAITIPAAATLSSFLGIVEEDLADGEYGRVQNSAWCDYARVANHASNATAIGDVLGMLAGQTYLQRIAAADGRPAFAISYTAIAANGVITPVARKVWLGTGVLGV